jgi:hypothetical protein
MLLMSTPTSRRRLSPVLVAMAAVVLAASATLAQDGSEGASPDASAPSSEVGGDDVFNGRDLAGWVTEGAAERKDGAPVWTVEDRAIVCRGEGFGFLRCEREVADFRLSLEFKLAAGDNSGVGIRHGKYTGRRGSRPSLAGYEIQLVDDVGKEPSKTSSGSLYRYVAPRVRALKPAGEWNELIVECRGPHIVVRLNGELIHDVDQTSIEDIAQKPLKGYVSLQNHGGDATFRHIRLVELK